MENASVSLNMSNTSESAAQAPSTGSGSDRAICMTRLAMDFVQKQASESQCEFWFSHTTRIGEYAHILHRLSKRFPTDPTLYVDISLHIDGCMHVTKYIVTDVSLFDSLSYLMDVKQVGDFSPSSPIVTGLLRDFERRIVEESPMPFPDSDKIRLYGEPSMSWLDFQDMLIRSTPEKAQVLKEVSS